MKFRLPAIIAFGTCVLLGPLLAAGADAPLPPLLGGSPTGKPAADTAVPRRSVLFALRIERFTPAEPGTAAAAATAAPPTVLGSPTLTTLDRDTATVAVTSPAFGYSVALSPVVETPAAAAGADTARFHASVEGAAAQTAQTVQTSWNVRLSGKSLPAGTTAVTLTGATRLTLTKSGVLAEITLREAETGKPTTYRIWATATLPDAPPAP